MTSVWQQAVCASFHTPMAEFAVPEAKHLNANDARKIYDKIKPYKVTTVIQKPDYGRDLRNRGYLWDDTAPVEPTCHPGWRNTRPRGCTRTGGFTGFSGQICGR